MTAEKRAAIRAFVKKWQGKGDEKQETHRFWMGLLQNVYDVADPSQYIEFEKKVQLGHQSYIDGYIPATKVLIEQKGKGINLNKEQNQSDGKSLTPYGQAKRYNYELPKDERADWIVVCNFTEFHIYDTNRPNEEPDIVYLKDLVDDYDRMSFLVDSASTRTKKEEKVSAQAGKIVGELYNALLKQYNDPENPETLQHLNKLCVRIVFLLYAEDAGILSERGLFHKYLKNHALHDVRRALMDLFETLNTPKDDRDEYIDETLNKFPYVNGGLFAEKIVIPRLDEYIVELILQKASADFDWSEINPTIFGAVFESTLNPETRRKGGMHYTSIENIHKVIDPLFLDGLYEKFEEILKEDVLKDRNRKLDDFQNKIANLIFLDPACGSGNFLTETYLSLRRLENMILRERTNQLALFEANEYSKNPIKVSIHQFYGIEINDFAVTVASAALWIAEIQMRQETEDIIFSNTHTNPELKVFPLDNFNTIVEGNALRMDWEDVVSKNKLNYIMGNPPFVGARLMDSAQKQDVEKIFDGWKNIGNLDYVACWYKKAADFMRASTIRTALVSTNSISQGESVALLWKPLFNDGIHIDFAHQTFRWDSEAVSKAHVHCVIIGFSVAPNNKPKVIYSEQMQQEVYNINGYLIDSDDICVESRKKPLCDIPEIGIGNKPIDDGNYLFTKEEMEEFIKKEPASKQYFRQWYGAREYINRIPRYCLWLGDCPISELRKMPECRKRVEAVKEFRLNSKSAGTQKLAEKPTRFHVENMPKSTYILIPRHSAQTRKYIPFGFVEPNIFCGDANLLMPNASLYEFGVLISNMHNAWMRTVGGRIKSDYRYSKDIVYNNFPWPNPTEAQKAKIEETAQGILDARALYPDASLADLYDELTMPPELRKAHQDNDRAVMAAYGLNKNSPEFKSESACVAMLMRMYQALTEKETK